MKPKTRGKVVAETVTEGFALPTAPKEVVMDLQAYTCLVYGREKWGKTTFFSSFPGALFFSTEPGSKGLSIYDFNSEAGGVKDWAILRAGVKLLVENPGQFKYVIIDTVDRAYDMCLDWVCQQFKIPYPGEDTLGREDHGKSWRAVKQEFTTQIHTLLHAGYGVAFTSHAKEATIRSRHGDEYSRIFPTMSGQARGVVEALVDMFFYGEYYKVNGDTVRVMVTEGDETVWAGHRPIAGKRLPRFIPVDEGTGYQRLLDAFEGKPVGIDPGALLPSKVTSKTGGEFAKRSSLIPSVKQPLRVVRKVTK